VYVTIPKLCLTPEGVPYCEVYPGPYSFQPVWQPLMELFDKRLLANERYIRPSLLASQFRDLFRGGGGWGG
jgi:hypothetical protein